jgi:hypothetical protein
MREHGPGKAEWESTPDLPSGITMIELKKRVALKATPLLIAFLVILFVPLSTVRATVIADLRIGKKPGFVRLVMEFDRRPSSSPSFSVERNRLRIELKGIANTPSAPKIIDDISRIDVSRKENKARIEAVFAFMPADIKTFALTGPHRFIVDAYRPLPASTALPPAKKNESEPVEQPEETAPEPYRVTEKSLVSLTSESSPNPSTVSREITAEADPGAPYAYKKRFQQRLVAALIAVTSIIVVLLFFLIRTADGRHRPRQQPWKEQLPQTPDPNIEAIDSAIHKLMKTYDRM